MERCLCNNRYELSAFSCIGFRVWELVVTSSICSESWEQASGVTPQMVLAASATASTPASAQVPVGALPAPTASAVRPMATPWPRHKKRKFGQERPATQEKVTAVTHLNVAQIGWRLSWRKPFRWRVVLGIPARLGHQAFSSGDSFRD